MHQYRPIKTKIMFLPGVDKHKVNLRNSRREVLRKKESQLYLKETPSQAPCPSPHPKNLLRMPASTTGDIALSE